LPAPAASPARVTERSALVRIRRADPREGERLREIAIAAKALWGYDLERVTAWAARGDFTARSFQERDVFVAEAERRVVAWAAVLVRGDVGWLDDLWVEPAWTRAGVGSELFRMAAARARRLGAGTIEWEAEPNAIGFYEKLGARYLRDADAPSAWGRRVPVYGLALG
jgi:GNAT superfamily N-acetyltransferase